MQAVLQATNVQAIEGEAVKLPVSSHTWPNSNDSASAVSTRGPGVARVHPQNVEHIPEVQAHCSDSHLHVRMSNAL